MIPKRPIGIPGTHSADTARWQARNIVSAYMHGIDTDDHDLLADTISVVVATLTESDDQVFALCELLVALARLADGGPRTLAAAPPPLRDALADGIYDIERGLGTNWTARHWLNRLIEADEELWAEAAARLQARNN